MVHSQKGIAHNSKKGTTNACNNTCFKRIMLSERKTKSYIQYDIAHSEKQNYKVGNQMSNFYRLRVGKESD